jgi:hypothetical protein
MWFMYSQSHILNLVVTITYLQFSIYFSARAFRDVLLIQFVLKGSNLFYMTVNMMRFDNISYE